MKITICCSVKYRDIIKKVIKELKDLGIEPLFLNLNCNDKNSGKANTMTEKKRLALEHYIAIDKADIVYLITPDGYMGTSVKLELGYAIAKKKDIYFSEPTNDLALDCYVKKFISLDKLSDFLKER